MSRFDAVPECFDASRWPALIIHNNEGSPTTIEERLAFLGQVMKRGQPFFFVIAAGDRGASSGTGKAIRHWVAANQNALTGVCACIPIVIRSTAMRFVVAASAAVIASPIKFVTVATLEEGIRLGAERCAGFVLGASA